VKRGKSGKGGVGGMASRKNDFTQGKMSANILRMAAPMTLALLINVLYSIVDRIYIGHMPEGGTLALAGIGLAFPIIAVVSAFQNLWSSGGAPLCSIARGEGDEEKAELNAPIAMELLKFFDSTSRSSAKTAETLDMLEKGQIRVRTDFSFEEKALKSVDRIAGYVIRALMIIALFIGSCLLCTIPPNAMETTPLFFAFPVVGSIGYVVSVFFAYSLYKSMKKGK
jgi:hypothetical protein